MARYRKTLTAAVGALLTWGAVVVTSDATQITSSEWLLIAGSLATALGVYAAPNDAPAGELPDPDISERG